VRIGGVRANSSVERRTAVAYLDPTTGRGGRGCGWHRADALRGNGPEANREAGRLVGEDV